MAVTVDTVVPVIGTLQICSSQPARPYMATLHVGQEWELHHVPTHVTQTPRLFPSACTPTLSPGCSQPHFGPHACIPGGGSEAVRTESCAGAGPEPSAPLLEPQCQSEQSADPGLQGYRSQSCPLCPSTHTHRLMMHRWSTCKDGGADGPMGQVAGLSVWGKGCGG